MFVVLKYAVLKMLQLNLHCLMSEVKKPYINLGIIGMLIIFN